jgi:mono/diheme cytochrome c family protein
MAVFVERNAGAAGRRGGADLGARDVEKIVAMVKRGGSQMPSFAGKLSEQDVQDVAAFVRQLH